jgi:hypothetical protein
MPNVLFNPKHLSGRFLFVRFARQFGDWLTHARGVNWYNVAKADPLIIFTRI